MADHPNRVLTQAAWDAAAQGDYGPIFDSLSDDICLENGPGAGPWHRASGKDDVALLFVEFGQQFSDTFRQNATCVFADDRMSLSLVHETGTEATSGDLFDNLAVYVMRFGPGGTINRIWTTDLDAEHCEEFWRANPRAPSRDFS
jgi:ketosteroid isomerase-like protein